LAERIARRISEGNGGSVVDARETRARAAGNPAQVGEELAAMRGVLAELQQKLSRLESNLTREEKAHENEARGTRRGEQEEGDDEGSRARAAASRRVPARVIQSPWLSGMYVPATTAATHPSQERFGVEEAAVSELVDYFEREKTCNLEPGGKPCDHCSMCSSRGF
jgi:hypothetical protein